MGVFVCLPDLFPSSRFRPPDRFAITAALTAMALVLCARLAGAQVVINELYYDHPGSDSGYEFAELMNVSGEPVAAGDLALEFHNGAGDGWEPLWAGGAGAIAPGGLFVVGGRLVTPVPDVVSGFSIQNGPDAVRVCVRGVETDRLGYGGLDDPSWCEGNGAAAVAAGRSLSRLPDGADSNDNGVDFSETVPTPGAFNVARRDVAVSVSGDTPAADVLPPDGFEHLGFDLSNAGVGPVAKGAVKFELLDSTATSVVGLETGYNGDALPPGGTYWWRTTVVLNPGYHRLTARLHCDGDERAFNNQVTLLRRVGGPAVIVSELLCYPADGCPQFVELYNAGGDPVDLNGYVLRDRAHPFTVVTRLPTQIAAGGFAVLTPDPASLANHFPSAPAASFVAYEGTWPSLNRTGSGGVADSVVLGDALRLAVAKVAYPPLGTEYRGRSLERIDMYGAGTGPVWVLSRDPAGASPGRSHDRALFRPPAPGRIDVTPRTFAPYSGETATVTVALETDAGGRVVAGVHDTRGRRLAELGSATIFPAVFVWDGTGPGGSAVPPGLYIVVCEFFAGAGERIDVQKVVVGCGRRRR